MTTTVAGRSSSWLTPPGPSGRVSASTAPPAGVGVKAAAARGAGAGPSGALSAFLKRSDFSLNVVWSQRGFELKLDLLGSRFYVILTSVGGETEMKSSHLLSHLLWESVCRHAQQRKRGRQKGLTCSARPQNVSKHFQPLRILKSKAESWAQHEGLNVSHAY